MVQLDKRRIIWDLHTIGDDLKSRHVLYNGVSARLTLDDCLRELSEYDFDRHSPVLVAVIKLAMVENDQSVDLDLLFHVINQAVQKVLDRNNLFWNTVISVSSSTIAWIDFRRKLSKWMSSNGTNPVHVRNVLLYVEKVLDKDGIGVVSKDKFLAFTQDLMGIDCLLCANVLGEPARSRKPIRRKPAPNFSNIITRPRVSINDGTNTILPLPEDRLNESTLRKSPEEFPIHLPVVPIKEKVTLHGKNPPSSRNNDISVSFKLRLGLAIVEKITNLRMRILYGYFRQPRSVSLETTQVVEETGIASSPVSESRMALTRIVGILHGVVLKHMAKGFYGIQYCMPHVIRDTPDQDHVEADAGSGPSWNVTMQAMAVASMYGIFRAAITRAIYPAFLSLRTGKSVDEVYAIRRVSYTQSTQGKKDSQVAAPVTQEGGGEHWRLDLIKENVPTSNLEFDLST